MVERGIDINGFVCLAEKNAIAVFNVMKAWRRVVKSREGKDAGE